MDFSILYRFCKHTKLNIELAFTFHINKEWRKKGTVNSNCIHPTEKKGYITALFLARLKKNFRWM